MMMYSATGKLRARCASTGLLVRALFWAYALWLVVLFGIGLWMLGQPAGKFTVQLLDVGGKLAGYGFYNGGRAFAFARGLLSRDALGAPKAVYLAGYFSGVAVRLVYLAILQQAADIFKSIHREDSPFLQQGCKRIFRIGVLLIASGVIKSGLLSTVLGVMGCYGDFSDAAAFYGGLLAGGVVICLSYVFEYGMALQAESDETL